MEEKSGNKSERGEGCGVGHFLECGQKVEEVQSMWQPKAATMCKRLIQVPMYAESMRACILSSSTRWMWLWNYFLTRAFLRSLSSKISSHYTTWNFFSELKFIFSIYIKHLDMFLVRYVRYLTSQVVPINLYQKTGLGWSVHALSFDSFGVLPL